MKKLLVTLVALVCTAPIFAQRNAGDFSFSEDKLYYGFRIGFATSHISGDEGIKASSSRTGINFGGIIGLRLSETTPVYLESGLSYVGKGGKSGGTKVSLNYLELPILVKYGFDVADKVAVLPFFGPYLSMAISGKVKADGDSHSSFNDGYYTHPDMGFKLGCGAEYSNLYLELGYEFGVANIADSGGKDAHNNSFFMNFGVNF